MTDQIEILPKAAKNAGCEAVVMQTGTGYSGEVSYYRLVAKAALGWRFRNWQWTDVVRYHRTTLPDTLTLPPDRDTPRSDGHEECDVEEYVGLYSGSWTSRGYTMDKTIVDLEAVFEQIGGNGYPLFDRGTGLILHGASGAILCDL